MKFILYITVVVSLCATALNAQEYMNYFGVKASNLTGYGIYLARDITDTFRAQTMGILYYYEKTESENSESVFNYDIGLEFQKEIYKGKNSRTYVLAGGYYYYDEDIKDYEDKISVINNSYNLGVGLGFEFSHKRIVYNFDFGYKFFEDDIDTIKNGKLTYDELERVTKIGAGAGIGFIF
jgi:hypothetical protein